MALYLLPPSGSISYERLTSYAYHRFHFLLRLTAAKNEPVKVQDILLEESTVAESECLIEDTKKDRISHFMLRLACSDDHCMSEFFLGAETKLFQLRFQNMNANELVLFLKKSLQTSLEIIRNFPQSENMETVSHGHILSLFEALSNFLQNTEQIKKLVNLYLEGDVANVIQIPFYYVLDLVKAREVVLKGGTAFVSVSKLGRVMTEVFRSLLEKGLESARGKHDSAAAADDDDRLKKLFQTLKKAFKRHRMDTGIRCDLPALSHTDVDQRVEVFPACMQRLHQALRQRHRLSHHARIQYTLFLKESGLPLHEALMFWRHEYSQPSVGQHGCHHTWQKDERRYTYNIRHLYGLEGSRINYRSHSCRALQQCISTGAAQGGGCPFANSDEGHLKLFLSSQGIPPNLQEEILSMTKSYKYMDACNAYLYAQIRKRSEISKPRVDEIQARTEMLNRNPIEAVKVDAPLSICDSPVRSNHKRELYSCVVKRKHFSISANLSKEKQCSPKVMRREETISLPHEIDLESICAKGVKKHPSASGFISNSVNKCSVKHSEFLRRNNKTDPESGIGLTVQPESCLCESDTEINSDTDLFEESDTSTEADFNSRSSEVKSVAITKLNKGVNRSPPNETELKPLVSHRDSSPESQCPLSDHTVNDLIDNGIGMSNVSDSEEDMFKQYEKHSVLHSQKSESRHLSEDRREYSDTDFDYDSETDLFEDSSSVGTDNDTCIKSTQETTYQHLSRSKDGGCIRQVVKAPVLKNHHPLTLKDISCTNTSCYDREAVLVSRSVDVISHINTDSQIDQDNVFNSEDNISVKSATDIDRNCNCSKNLVNGNSFLINDNAPRFNGSVFGEKSQLLTHKCSTSNAKTDGIHSGDFKTVNGVSGFLEKREILKPLDYYSSFQRFLKQLKECDLNLNLHSLNGEI